MSEEIVENVIELSGERARRVHDQNERRLQNVRAAFAKALPFVNAKSSSKKKPKKKR